MYNKRVEMNFRLFYIKKSNKLFKKIVFCKHISIKKGCDEHEGKYNGAVGEKLL